MSNSPTRRIESSYMHPKKYYCRLDSINSNSDSTQETQNSTLEVKESNKMGQIDDGIKSNLLPAVKMTPDGQPVSPNRQQYVREDGPIDFSVKNHNRKSSGDSFKSTEKPVNGVYSHPMLSISYPDSIRKCLSSTPFMPNDKISSPAINGNPGTWLPNGSSKHLVESYERSGSSPKMDYSESPREHITPISAKSRAMFCEPGERQSSPDEKTSHGILQRMLKSQDVGKMRAVTSKLQNVDLNSSETPQGGHLSGLMNSTNPIVPVDRCQIQGVSPVNGYMPFGSFPYMPTVNYGPHVPPMPPTFMPPTEFASLEAMSQERSRKRKSENRPFKALPLDKIEEKLQSVSANALGFGFDLYNQLLPNERQSRSPPSELSTTNSTDGSPEYRNGAITSNSPHAANGAITSSNIPHAANDANHNPPGNNAQGSGDSNDSLQQGEKSETSDVTSCSDSRKRKVIADVDKDDVYWDRRRKNNLAAKRSREARRRKEDAIAKMAGLYEAQNKQLSHVLMTLQYQLGETISQYNRLLRDNESVMIQNTVLQERLSQRRCGQCGSQLPNVN